MVLCTRPTREHYKTALIARVSRFFCNTSLGDFSQERKKEIINPFVFISPTRYLWKIPRRKMRSITGAKKKKELGKVHSYNKNLFIEGYGSSTITESLCWLLQENSRALKNYMLTLQLNTPVLLAASIERPNRDEAMGSFVSRLNLSSLKSTKEGLQCPAMF